MRRWFAKVGRNERKELVQVDDEIRAMQQEQRLTQRKPPFLSGEFREPAAAGENPFKTSPLSLSLTIGLTIVLLAGLFLMCAGLWVVALAHQR
jgi:hypothetical protein